MNWTEAVNSSPRIYHCPENKVSVYEVAYSADHKAKVIAKQIECEDEAKALRAEAEAKIVQEHPHPGINTCLGCKKEAKPDRGFYVYIFSEPMLRSLFDDIGDRAKVEQFYTEEQLWDFSHSLLEALHYLQTLGIAHRDIKPHNILIDSEGQIKLCDFGFAKHIDLQVPAVHSLLGSALYWSPKLRQAYMDGKIPKVQHNPFKSDVFSLGLTLVNLTLLALPNPLHQFANLQQFIDDELDRIDRYSKSWVDLLRSMLRVEEAHRPDFMQLKTPILYADDEELPQVLGGEEIQSPLQLSAKCGYNHVRVSEREVDTVPCMITITACSQPSGQRTYGVDLMCVIDQSGSMEGRVMDLVKISLNGLLTRLDGRDRMSLVGFNNEAERKCPLIRCSEEGKARLKDLIEALDCRRMTNISKGFQMGVEVLKRRRTANQATSLLLFSDGCNNLGVNPTLPCMSALKHCDLTRFTVCTFGFGDELDSQLLEALANTRKGEFQHITEAQQIPEVFNFALGNITTVVARNLRVSIALLPSNVPCELAKIYTKEKNNIFELPDLHANEQKELIFLLKPAHQALLRNVSFPAVQVDLSYTDNDDTDASKSVRLDVKFMKWDGTAKPTENSDVFRHWCRVQGAEYLRDARELASEGNFREADSRLGTGIELIRSSGYADVPLVREVLGHMKQAREMVQSEQDWKKGGDPFFASISYSHFEQSATVLTRYYMSPQQRGNHLADIEERPAHLES